MNRLSLRGIDQSGATNGQVPIWDAASNCWKPGAGSAGAGLNGTAGRPPRLVPYGVKLRGANIVPRDGVGNAWATLYANWSSKWSTIVKPQIDKAASVGANAIRLIGDVGGVHTGALTQAAYVAAYEQFVDYCANQGLYVYACLSDPNHWDGATKEQALVVMQAQAAMLETKPNVIGIDVAQELGLAPSVWTGSTQHALASFLLTGLRSVTTLPLTCSGLSSSNNSTAQWSDGTVAAFADLVDFYDYHPYYSTLAPSDLTPTFTANTAGKPILLGEWGATTASGTTYHQNAALVQALPQVVGGFIWSIVDNAASVDWALFDWSWAERTVVTTVFRTVPDREQFPHGGHLMQDEGTTLPARGRINVAGAGVTATDDPTNDATKVTVPGLTVKDEGATVDTAQSVNYVGANVSATTDGAGHVTVTITGGSASSGEVLMQDGVTGPPVPIETEARDDWLYQG